MVKWIKFDRNNLPLDGHYPARLEIPGRTDNPGYNKIRVLNGQCHEHFLDIVTHYAEDNDPEEQNWSVRETIDEINRKVDKLQQLLPTPYERIMKALITNQPLPTINPLLRSPLFDKDEVDTPQEYVDRAGRTDGVPRDYTLPSTSVDPATGESTMVYSWLCPGCSVINQSSSHNKSPVDETQVLTCKKCNSQMTVYGDIVSPKEDEHGPLLPHGEAIDKLMTEAMGVDMGDPDTESVTTCRWRCSVCRCHNDEEAIPTSDGCGLEVVCPHCKTNMWIADRGNNE